MQRTVEIREVFVSIVSQVADALSDAIAENSGENIFTIEAYLLQYLLDKLPDMIDATEQAAKAEDGA